MVNEDLSYERYVRLRRAVGCDEASDVTEQRWNSGAVSQLFIIDFFERKLWQKVDAEELPAWGSW